MKAALLRRPKPRAKARTSPNAPRVCRNLLRNAAQFIAGALADGYGDARDAHHLALELSAAGGEGAQMQSAIRRLNRDSADAAARRKGNE